MTTIGILGAGRVGTNLARALAASGHQVTLGRRGSGDHATVASGADIVINATPGDTTLERLTALRAELAGKILVDVSNATHDAADGLPGDLCYPGGSLAEQLQAALPGTQVVKTLNTMLFTVMTDPGALTTPPTAYLSGNDEQAKKTVAGLLGDLGWDPGWIADLGDITTARATEAMVLVVPHVLRRNGFTPFAVSIAR
ncbi:NADP oxidoreductase [Amycolatopsis sp. MJM2582]|uniref:NADPH-dependent F420 reductase n=1 Tax=Amycolatopsis sp. MJM2582 TaxID=1427749 RepID=UPI0005040C32|nr:NAD(P)-binding domain-containing protein [Amycolatopsis sp. MJM2582]KFZ78034.1 NADP oxidoreductase [Amycolatopsis sp. MJM2582]